VRGFNRQHQSCFDLPVIAAIPDLRQSPRPSQLPTDSYFQPDRLRAGADRPPASPSGAALSVDLTNDHALMLAVRDGELDALGVLFERHHGPLFGFLLKLTGDRTAAEDLTQIVFQRMLKYRHTYRNEGSFTAWMYHLARRCAADHFRRATAAAHVTDPAVINEHIDETPHAAQQAASRDDHALLQAALARLDREDREILLLARFQELSFADIAAILECSAGAAKVRAHRALRELRTTFFRLQHSNPTTL
jgi:RNA polymerase sigma factor (sigma-70 family)